VVALHVVTAHKQRKRRDWRATGLRIAICRADPVALGRLRCENCDACEAMQQESTIPFEESTIPFEESTIPFEESTIPFEESTIPFEESTIPFEESTINTEESTKHTEEAVPALALQFSTCGSV
jgi:ferredoxin